MREIMDLLEITKRRDQDAMAGVSSKRMELRRGRLSMDRAKARSRNYTASWS